MFHNLQGEVLMFDLNTLHEIEIIKENERQKLTLCQNSEGLKVLKREINGDKREIYKSLQMINHPCIPKIHSVELSDKTVVIEEYVNGASLNDMVINKKTITKRDFDLIINQLLSALDVLHSNKIIHRDIKPDNILIDNSNHLWLIDYDIARINREEIRQDTETLGTFGYAPIEQYGMLPTDFKTDIYAFGMTMKSLLDYIGIKGWLLKVADKCTRLDPSERYRDIKSLKKAFNRRKKMWIALFSLILLISVMVFLLMNFKQTLNTDKQVENITDNVENFVENGELPVTEELPKPEEIINEPESEEKTEEPSNETPEESLAQNNEAENETKPNVTEEKPVVEDENWQIDGFGYGTVESEYRKYPRYSSATIFSVDQDWEHIMFCEDMTKEGRIKLGRENTKVNAKITLNNGILNVSLNDGKGNDFNKNFKFDGQYTYKKSYDEDLRHNADIICRDLDGDGIMELLVGVNEVAIGVMFEQFYANFNYCMAWCIRYDENSGFILCNGDMFSEGAQFSLNKYANKVNIRWNDMNDITGYALLGNDIKPVY